jgi:hypothetical protein
MLGLAKLSCGRNHLLIEGYIGVKGGMGEKEGLGKGAARLN